MSGSEDKEDFVSKSFAISIDTEQHSIEAVTTIEEDTITGKILIHPFRDDEHQ